MNAPVKLPTFGYALRGYAARQWRRRLPLGQSREVGLAVLPADAQAYFRDVEAALPFSLVTLTAMHNPGGEIAVVGTFV